jgi:hypothetical protein
MRQIEVELQGDHTSARAMRSDVELSVSKQGRFTKFTVPELDAYEVVVLDDAADSAGDRVER